MDPLLDEKIILTISQILPEFFLENFDLLLKREAFGPSLNEGICYEFCTLISFTGDFSGKLFICMDGATKLKTLPYISKNFFVDTYQKGMANSILMEITNQMVANFIQEFTYAKFKLSLQAPEIWNHKVFLIDFNQYRQYVIIFNINNKTDLLGRLYCILLLEK